MFPTHGFGSFCSATPTSGDASTVGEQQQVNPALTQDEQVYVETLMAGLGAYPAYYAHMGPINRRGPAPVDLSLPEPVDPTELRRRIQDGEWVVDLRERTAFAAGHLTGSLGFELSTNFVTYLGWLYTYGTPLTLIGDTQEQVADARRELVRIGIDDLAGMAVGDIATLTDGSPLRSYRVSDFAGLAAAKAAGPVQILDARRDDEWADGHVHGRSPHPAAPAGRPPRRGPPGEVWVYCGSGYRASIAASFLDHPGRDVVLVNDSYDHARQAGLENEPTPQPPAPRSPADATAPPHDGEDMTTATTRRAPTAPDTVDAATVIDWARRPDDVTIIDVRTPAEYETMHIPGSYNVPVTCSASTPPSSPPAWTATSSSSASPAPGRPRPGTPGRRRRRRTCTSSTAASPPTPPPAATSCADAPAGRWTARSASPPARSS